MDVTKIVKTKGVDGKDYYSDGAKYYIVHKYEKDDKGLMNMARVHLKDQSRFPEILRLNTTTDKAEEITNKNSIFPHETFLLPSAPPVAPTVVPAVVPDTFTLAEDMNVRTSASATDLTNYLYTAVNKTKFTYNKSSLVKDADGRVWAEVTLDPAYKDKVGKPIPKGWICVKDKDGTTFFTAEKIDMPAPAAPKMGKG